MKKIKLQLKISADIRKELYICAMVKNLKPSDMLEEIIKTYLQEHPYWII